MPVKPPPLPKRKKAPEPIKEKEKEKEVEPYKPPISKAERVEKLIGLLRMHGGSMSPDILLKILSEFKAMEELPRLFNLAPVSFFIIKGVKIEALEGLGIPKEQIEKGIIAAKNWEEIHKKS